MPIQDPAQKEDSQLVPAEPPGPSGPLNVPTNTDGGMPP
ncbi:Hypothetical protein AA314_01727 [Archangium gephyra]|nr:Hypothetical protein AA314_01727 [Archangium gephyra]